MVQVLSWKSPHICQCIFSQYTNCKGSKTVCCQNTPYRDIWILFYFPVWLGFPKRFDLSQKFGFLRQMCKRSPIFNCIQLWFQRRLKKINESSFWFSQESIPYCEVSSYALRALKYFCYHKPANRQCIRLLCLVPGRNNKTQKCQLEKENIS